MNILINKVVIYFLLVFVCIECTPAPRYKNGVQNVVKKNINKKNIKKKGKGNAKKTTSISEKFILFKRLNLGNEAFLSL